MQTAREKRAERLRKTGRRRGEIARASSHSRRTGKLEQVDHARLDLGPKNRKRADRDIATNFPQSWPRMPCARVISGRHVNNLPSPIPANHTEEKRNRARCKSSMIQVLCHFIPSSHSSSRDVGYVILYNSFSRRIPILLHVSKINASHVAAMFSPALLPNTKQSQNSTRALLRQTINQNQCAPKQFDPKAMRPKPNSCQKQYIPCRQASPPILQ